MKLWTHHTPDKMMSYVLDENGDLVCGSKITQQRNKRAIDNHERIVKAVNLLTELEEENRL